MLPPPLCASPRFLAFFSFFFFNDTATTEIYTLSLHDALPILSQLDRTMTILSLVIAPLMIAASFLVAKPLRAAARLKRDRKSTRLNSSHGYISYAVFCLKKKTQTPIAAPRSVDSRVTRRTRRA